MTPLYNHTSAETAYLVPDYPYGRTVRCRIRYWIEADKRKGFRFCSQTEKPGTTHWNKPKKSTYSEFAACLYLDEVGHVQCARIDAYCDAPEVLAFVQRFPLAPAPMLLPLASAKIKMLTGLLDGSRFFTINGERQPRHEHEDERDRAELAIWHQVAFALGGKVETPAVEVAA